MTVDDMLAVLKVVSAAGATIGLSGISKRVWQKVLSFLAAIFLAHLAYFVAASVALSYHWIVLPDFLVNLFMPGFALWGAMLGAVLAYARERIRKSPTLS
jgi:hypothetical protein